jgi:sortase A
MAPLARISIPRLGLSEVALDSGSGQVLAFGPTFLPTAAQPGADGTAVAAAHRDTHFRGLDGVRIGDAIVVEGIDGRSTTYRVDSLQVTRWDRFAVSPDRSTPRLALVTCYPFGATTHGPLRFIVQATKA